MITAAAACLAIAMFLEARGEPELGMQYVGHIVMNLSEDRHMTPCEIISNKAGKRDFDFAIGGKTLKQIHSRISLTVAKSDIERAAWEKAVKAGRIVSVRKRDITGGAKFFNVVRKGVRYKTNLKPKTIGGHIFY